MAISGTVRGLGANYRDGVERLEIHVGKAGCRGLPVAEGQRVPITLVFGGKRYEAGLRSKADYDYVWVCPDVTDEQGRGTKLSSASLTPASTRTSRSNWSWP